jgi:hypothetical protein
VHTNLWNNGNTVWQFCFAFLLAGGTRKALGKTIAEKAGVLDSKMSSLATQLQGDEAEVQVLGSKLGEVMESMQGKANAESLQVCTLNFTRP